MAVGLVDLPLVKDFLSMIADPTYGDVARADDPSANSLYDTCAFAAEKSRYGSLEELGMLDTTAEPPFERITKAMSSFFKTPVSLITLVADPSRVWFKSCVGPFGACVERDGSWCNYILVPETPEILITEDATKDARFAHNPYVAGPPYIKFYAGAPLVGARGERYGTLCIVDLVQRAFTAELYSLLTNFAALAVEELERNKPLLEEVTSAANQDIVNNRYLDMSLVAAREGAVMLDMRGEGWPMLYVNPAFETSSGLTADELVDCNFWDHFERANKTQLDLGAITGRGDVFEIQMTSKKSGRWLNLRMMPATSDRLAPSKATGIPSWVPSEDAAGCKLGLEIDTDRIVDVNDKDKDLVPDSKCFWLAIVVESGEHISAELTATTTISTAPSTGRNSGASQSSGCSSLFGDYKLPDELPDVTLGPLLGSGSFGKVFRGIKSGAAVAVKVIDCRGRSKGASQAQLDEIQIASGLEHPNIVKMIGHVKSESESRSGKTLQIAWIVQELCNLGTLSSAGERGWLRQKRSIKAPPDMAVLLNTLGNVADAMAYVHERNIVHADLTGRNVLLHASSDSPAGFIAKVCDFGISKVLTERTVSTDTVGTITHMPPELMTDNLLCPGADVWAFGVVAWEAFHGKSSYKGKSVPSIVIAVARNTPLPWPEDAPADFVSIMKHCMSFQYQDRPTFPEVLERLVALSCK